MRRRLRRLFLDGDGGFVYDTWVMPFVLGQAILSDCLYGGGALIEVFDCTGYSMNKDYDISVLFRDVVREAGSAQLIVTQPIDDSSPGPLHHHRHHLLNLLHSKNASNTNTEA